VARHPRTRASADREGRETAFLAPIALPDNSVSAILEDVEKNIWVGTDDGLVRMTSPSVGLLNARNGLEDDNVSSVYHDHHGIIWITTVTGGVYRYINGRLELARLPEAASRPSDPHRLRRSHGRVLVRYQQSGRAPRRWRKQHAFHNGRWVRNNGIQAFAADRENNVWIGTTSGISVWDGQHFRNYYLEDGLSYGWVRAIVQDRNGDMLIGTDRGMNRFHNGRFIRDSAFAQLGRDKCGPSTRTK